MQIFSRNNNRGFSLIELLVVISIIFILSGIIAINYKSGQKQLALNRAASKLAQDIRRAQEMAMSAKECQECSGGGVPEAGYGIVFNTIAWGDKEYRLYAETGGGDNFFQGEPPDTLVGPVIELEKGVYISNLDINGSRNKVSINFKPPDPEIAIKYTPSDGGDEAIITLALESDPSKTKTIRVNKAGRIEID